MTDSQFSAVISRIQFAVLAGLLAFIAVPYGGAERWWEAAFGAVVFALMLLHIVEGEVRGGWRPCGSALLLPPLVIAAYALIQSLNVWHAEPVSGQIRWWPVSADTYETKLFALKLLSLIVFGHLLFTYATTTKRIWVLVHVVMVVGVLTGMFGLARQLSQGSGALLDLPALELGRGYGQFINRNHFAYVMEMSLGLLLGLVVCRGVAANRRSLYAVGAAVVWVATVMANTRGGIISVTLETAFIFVAAFWLNRWGAERVGTAGRAQMLKGAAGGAALTAGLLISLVVGATLVGGDQVADRMETVSSEVKEMQDKSAKTRRIDIWEATWSLIKDNPVTGVGFAGYKPAIASYHTGSGEFLPEEAHNDYLELLACGGIAAAAVCVWFLMMLAKRVTANFSSGGRFRHASRLGAVGGMFGVAVHSGVDFGLHLIAVAALFVTLMVIASAECNDEEGQPPSGHGNDMVS